MKQGEIWDVYFGPVQGSEQSGRRPALIISGNLLNKYLDVVIVCPLTSKIKHYKGNVILNPDDRNNLKSKSEVLLFHIRSVTKGRLKRKIGEVEKEVVDELRVSLNDILRY